MENAVNIVKCDRESLPTATAEHHYMGVGYRFPMTAYLLSI